MSHIVLDARRLHQTTGRYTRNLITQLEKIDETNHYTVIVNPEDEEWWTPKNPRFTRHTVTEDHYSFGEQLGLAWKIYRLKADLVHFLMPQQPLLYFRKNVTTIHDLTLVEFNNAKASSVAYSAKQFIFRQALAIFAKRAKAIVTITNFSKEGIAEFAHVQPEKIHVTYPASDPIKHAPRPINALKNKQFILYVGNHAPHKNIRMLVDALPELLEKNPTLKLALVSKEDYHYNSIKDHVRSKGLDDHVHFTGFVDDAELRWLYEQTACYAFPTLNEGFGLPGLEALQHGAPVAVSNASCLPEVYEKAVAYFDPHNTHSIAKIIHGVIHDTDEQKRQQKEAKTLLSKYSWETMAQDTLTVYTSLLEQ